METDKSPAVWTTKRETRLRFKGNHLKNTKVIMTILFWDQRKITNVINRGTKIQLDCLEAESKRLQSASVGRDKTRRQKRAGCFHHLTERTTLRTSQNNQSSFYRQVGPTHINTHQHTATHTNTHRHTPIRLHVKLNLMTGAAIINQIWQNFTASRIIFTLAALVKVRQLIIEEDPINQMQINA